MEAFEVSYRELAEVAVANDKVPSQTMSALIARYPDLNSYQREVLTSFMKKYFLPTLRQKWRDAYRKAEEFWSDNVRWLEKTFTALPSEDAREIAAVSAESMEDNRRKGRPVKPFSECCERSKRRKVQEIRAELDEELLRQAATTPRVPRAKALA